MKDDDSQCMEVVGDDTSLDNMKADIEKKLLTPVEAEIRKKFKNDQKILMERLVD